MDNNMYENELALDNPIKYKELTIYPITVENYMLFQMVSNVILIRKNEIPDFEVIKMSYLDFIFHLIETEENEDNRIFYYSAFVNLMLMCLKIDDFKYIKDEYNHVKLIINDIEYDWKDFDEIKRIIKLQNIPDDDSDEYIDPKMKQALDEAIRFMNRNKKKMGSFEDQMICIMISTSLNMEEIKQLTIRKFVKILQRVDHKLHYEIYRSASLSGMVEFKNEIEHWTSEIKYDKYANVLVDYQEASEKFDKK